MGIEKPDVADAKITFEMPLAGKMEPGEKIQFMGTAKDWRRIPRMYDHLRGGREGRHERKLDREEHSRYGTGRRGRQGWGQGGTSEAVNGRWETCPTRENQLFGSVVDFQAPGSRGGYA